MITAFIHIRFLDIVDILLVAILLYQIYMLIRGTVAFRIFVGIFFIYLIWLLVRAMKMELIGTILGQVIGVGMVALIVVFQQEIRQFLLMIGNKYVKTGKFNFVRSSKMLAGYSLESINNIAEASREMAAKHTGALIVISRDASLKAFAEQGVVINADISVQLIKSIFYKDAPLHDGAILLENNKIFAAKCVLPVSANTELPNDYGLRHRSGLGMTENTDTIVIIVSEQTGNISIAKGGKIYKLTQTERLAKIITSYLRNNS